MTARVLYRDAQGRTGEVALDPNEPCYVGRALDCAVRTDDAMVSRKHSLIRMENGRFLVEDLGSSNGTHVNDIKVSRQTLNHNDVVRCGNLWLRYIDDLSSDSPQARPQDAGGSSKYRNTLGGGSAEAIPPRAPPQETTPAPPNGPAPTGSAPAPSPSPPAHPSPRAPSPPPSPASLAPTPQVAPSPPPMPPTSPPTSPTAAPGSPAFGNDSGPSGPAAAPVIRPDMRGKPLPRRQQSADATPISSDKPTGPELYETDPAGPLTRDQLERRLALADEYAHELERGLHTLQAELQAAQEKIKALLRSVQELTGLKR